MDLQASQSTNPRPTMGKLATLFCFALACVLMIGSLVAPERSQRIGQPGAPLSWNSLDRLS